MLDLFGVGDKTVASHYRETSWPYYLFHVPVIRQSYEFLLAAGDHTAFDKFPVPVSEIKRLAIGQFIIFVNRSQGVPGNT
jgi:hypothetical protein